MLDKLEAGRALREETAKEFGYQPIHIGDCKGPHHEVVRRLVARLTGERG